MILEEYILLQKYRINLESDCVANVCKSSGRIEAYISVVKMMIDLEYKNKKNLENFISDFESINNFEIRKSIKILNDWLIKYK